jgi:hypothetical protein
MELHLDSDPETILKGITGLVTLETTKLQALIATCAEEENPPSVTALKEEIDKLNTQTHTYGKTREVKEKALARAKSLEAAATGRLYRRRDHLDEVQRGAIAARARGKEAKVQLDSLNGLYSTKEGFSSSIGPLLAVKSLIDTREPVFFGFNHFSWTTIPIHIRGFYGQPLPMPFGRFKVDLRVVNRQLRSSWAPLEPQIRDSDFCHPHIKRGGEACLGNAASMLFKAVTEMNIAMAVTIADEYLCSYNFRDPYLKLRFWVPNRWDTPMCECGLVYQPACHCSKCVICAKKVTEGEDLVICDSCASLYLSYCDMSDRMQSGIGGTGYILNRDVGGYCLMGRHYAYCKGFTGQVCDCEELPYEVSIVDGVTLINGVPVSRPYQNQ